MKRIDKAVEIEHLKGTNMTIHEIKTHYCPVDYGMMTEEQCSAYNEDLPFIDCFDECWNEEYIILTEERNDGTNDSTISMP